jgi:hypothetical protein
MFRVIYNATKIPFMYSFSGNCAASVLIYTFMCVSDLYIPMIVNRSQTRNSFSGNICFKFRYWFFAVYSKIHSPWLGDIVDSSLCSLAGRYDNPMPELTWSPQSGSMNMATVIGYTASEPLKRLIWKIFRIRKLFSESKKKWHWSIASKSYAKF